jgi:hypothetical protein
MHWNLADGCFQSKPIKIGEILIGSEGELVDFFALKEVSSSLIDFVLDHSFPAIEYIDFDIISER